jgi:hypothetical protein
MRKWFGIVATTVAFVSSLAAFEVSAGERNEWVQFRRGASSAVVNGSIRGYVGVNYHLNAAQNQVMKVNFRPSNGACYFNVFAPGSAEAIHIGSSAGNSFGGTLSVNGDYRIQVYLMRSAARRNEVCRYSLSVSITGGGGGGGGSAISDSDMKFACIRAASRSYGVSAGDIEFEPDHVFPATDGWSLEGFAHQGRYTKHRFNCIFRKNRTLKDVMGLDSDGE